MKKIRSSALLILVAILFIAAAVFYYQEILFRAGRFLAPNELASAEVIIIEGRSEPVWQNWTVT